MKSCKKIALEISKRFDSRRLVNPTIKCKNPQYALCIFFRCAGEGCIDVELWPDVETLNKRINDALYTWTMDQLCVLRVEPGYLRIKITAEVIE